MTVVDSRDNYKYENEEDIPDGSDEEAWPYGSDIDDICTHEFLKIQL